MGARVTILVGHHSDVMVKGRLGRLFHPKNCRKDGELRSFVQICQFLDHTAKHRY
jgi:hypothetical protein